LRLPIADLRMPIEGHSGPHEVIGNQR